MATTVTSVSFPEPVSFVIELSIPNFSSKRSQTTAIVSDGVIVCKSTWTLQVIPLQKTDVGEKEVDSVNLYLYRQIHDVESDRSDIYVLGKFGVVDGDSPTKKVLPKLSRPLEQTYTTRSDNQSYGWGKQLLPHSDIWGDSPTLHLKDDLLTIRVEATCSVLKEHQKYRAPLAEFLRQKSKNMYNNRTARDFVLVSSDGTERTVHKLVLMGSSPVFRRMLESNLEECKTGRCEISDIDSATLDGLIRFMYLGSVEKVKDNAKNLLVAADKYDLQALKDRCEDALVEELNADNVVDLLMFAEKMSAPVLKKGALRYMAADPEKTLAWSSTQTLFGSADKELTTEAVTAMFRFPTK